MAVNTEFKLTWLDDTEIFTFPEDWRPLNEQVSPALTGEDINLPFENLVDKIAYGLGKSVITLQGQQIDNADRWELSSAVVDRRLKKLWLGEDWYYYVLGMEPRKIRDVERPLIGKYTAAFEALDPFQYNSNDGQPKTPSAASANFTSATSNTVSVDLTDSTEPQNTTFIEPCFWIETDSSSTVSSVQIDDDTNRTVEYSGLSIGNSETWIVMPYLNTAYEGFTVQDAVMVKTANSPDKTSSYALDLPLYRDYRISSEKLDKGNIEYPNMRPTSTSNDYDPVMNRYYPRAEDDVTTDFDVALSGTINSVDVTAQYLLRRV